MIVSNASILSFQLVSLIMQKKPNCLFFQRGSCKKGPECEFLHVLDVKQPCFFFQQGSCKKGDACDFPHILIQEGNTLPQEDNALPQPQTQHQTQPQFKEPKNNQQQKECIYFQKGNCKNGENCEFLHVDNEVAPLRQKQCAFFLKGMCRNGENCEYVHNVTMQNPNLDQKQTRNQRKCAYFQKGHCNKGDTCTFLHVLETVNVPVNQPVVNQPVVDMPLNP